MRLILLSLFLISCTSPKYSKETAKQVDRTVAIVQRHHPEDPDINRLKYDTERHSNESPTGVDTEKLSFFAGLVARFAGLDPVVLNSILASLGIGSYGAVKHVTAKRTQKGLDDMKDKFHEEKSKRLGAMDPEEAKKEFNS